MAYRLDRFLIRLSGPDAASFLDALVTQNLERLDQTPALYAGLLTPQGKLFADMIVWREPDGLLIETDPARGPALLSKLNMHKLRANVRITQAEDLCVLWDKGEQGDAPDPRRPDGALGWRRIAPADDAIGLEDGSGVLAARMLALGVPDLVRDGAIEDAFALEALFEELHGVDFKKGCFLGQENVSRMKRRATTRKKFCPISFDGPTPAYATPIRAGEAEIGAVRSGAEGRALAFVRLDRALDAVAKGVPLTAGKNNIRLDPPDWLILPPSGQGE